MASGIALLLASLTLDGCTRYCTAVGCNTDAARIDVNITTPPAQLENGLLRVCRNSECTEAEIKLESGQLLLAEPRRNLLSMQLVGRLVEPHMLLIVPSYNELDLADGDEYSLELLSATGAVLEEWHWVADYTETYPNGRDCDDYACRRVELN